MQEDKDRKVDCDTGNQEIQKRIMTHEWNLRTGSEDDIPFIYSTWTNSMQGDSRIGRSCKRSIFYEGQTQVIDWILAQEDTEVLVASNPDDPNIIFGYLVYQPDIVHYAFVKEIFRRFGIASYLHYEAGSPKFYTHETGMIRPIQRDLIYNPYLLFKGVTHGSKN